MTNQTKTNLLKSLIDPADRTSFSKHQVPKVELKDFNVLIYGKSFFFLMC